MLHGDSFSSTLFNVSLKTVIDKVNVTKKGARICKLYILEKSDEISCEDERWESLGGTERHGKRWNSMEIRVPM